MTDKKRNTFYWLFKILAVVISCALPIWAICERYPVWIEVNGKSHSLGAGGILILIVLLVIFRKTVFSFLKDRLKLKHTPPIVAWIVMIIISYTLMYISNILYDITIVFWMGLIGCATGTFLTFIAENRFKKEKDNNGQNG